MPERTVRNTVVLKQPQILTKLDIWAPRYNDKYGVDGEEVILLAAYKVDKASPIILIEFTRRPSLKGQRFCVPRQVVIHSPVDTNGKIPCYAVGMSQLKAWISQKEEDMYTRETLVNLGWMQWTDFK